MPPRKVKTRMSASAWLIGGEEPRIRGDNRLPTLRSVLQYVLHLHKPPAVPIREACARAVDDLLPFWVRGGVPTVSKEAAIKRLLKLHSDWVELKRSMQRPSTNKREAFIAALDKLFDIGAPDAEKKVTLEEDRQFYRSMKEDRKASMVSVDNNWVKRKARKLKRLQGQQQLKRRSDDEVKSLFTPTSKMDVTAVSTFEDSDAYAADKSETEDAEFHVPLQSGKKKNNVLSKAVTSALDRTQTSDKFAAHIIKQTVTSTLNALADSLGVESTDLDLKPNCSKTSIIRRRHQNRIKVVAEARENLSSEPGPFLVHWDGKLLADGSDDNKKYDRLPVLVTGLGVEQLLGVPRIESGTGRSQAEASHKLLKDWGVEEKTVGAVFDTTASNTGCIKGACKILGEEMLGKELLNCACRHHVDELVPGAATTDLLGESNDPRLPFFAKLDNGWKDFDKTKYRTAASTRKLRFMPDADETLVFCQNQLAVRQPRGDYREFLELVILFLGGVVPNKVVYSFKKPGALSKTRWMMRAIYSLKTWMFGRQLKLSTKEDSKIFLLNVFVCRAYVQKWFRATLAAEAPRIDLEFLKTLYRNRHLGSHWRAALEKFSTHLWYLSPMLLCFSLFDDKVPLEEKNDLVTALRGSADDDADMPIRAEVVLGDALLDMKLRDFVTKKSLKFFSVTGISPSFLEEDPVTWRADEAYQHGLNVVKNFKVVNDCAERAVQLITRYLKGNKITSDEEARQVLLVTVAEDRKNNNLS